MNTKYHVDRAFDTSPFEDPASAMGFTEAVAAMLDAAHELTNPREMNRLFQRMWQAYANLYTVELSLTLQAVVGDKYAQLIEHEDTQGVSRQIFQRLAESGFKPGADLQDVDISDILEDAGIT